MKSMGYRLYNTKHEVFSKGAIDSGWRSRSEYHVRTSVGEWKTFKNIDAIKNHLLNMLMKNVSTEHWVIQEIFVDETNAPLQDLCDEKMLMKMMKKK